MYCLIMLLLNHTGTYKRQYICTQISDSPRCACSNCPEEHEEMMKCCFQDKRLKTAIVKENVTCVRFLDCLRIVWNKVFLTNQDEAHPRTCFCVFRMCWRLRFMCMMRLFALVYRFLRIIGERKMMAPYWQY